MSHVACAAYMFVPNEHTKESAFFLVFGRDTFMLLMQLLNPTMIYMGDDRILLALHFHP